MTEAGSRTANLIGMAKSAELAGNGQEAIDYYNRVLEDDPGVSEAWLGKGRAAGRMSSLANVRVAETVVAFGHAMATADPTERQVTASRAVADLVDISEAIHNLAWKHFREFASVDNSWTMCVDVEAKLLDALWSAREWDFHDPRPLDLTVTICKALLDQGVLEGFADFLRERRDEAVEALRSIDPGYAPPPLADVTRAEVAARAVRERSAAIAAKQESDALGYIVLILILIFGPIIVAIAR